MLLEQILFFVAAIGAIGGALGVVLLRNPFFSVLALVAHLVSLALLFLLLRAEFIAAAQLVVYAGAVMVLYVFVVAYIGGIEETVGGHGLVGRLGALFAGALLAELTIAIVGSGLPALDSRGANVPAGFGSPGAIGKLLLEKFLIPFEAASMLLLVACVGALVLSRRLRGVADLEDDVPERAGKAPIGGDYDPTAGEGPDLGPPPGTAEGVGDPTPVREAEVVEEPA